MPIDQATLGNRLREARVNCGLSQEAVAKELGIPRTAVVHIEGGNRAVSTVELAEMARLYGRPIVEFFRESPVGEEDVLTALGRISTEFHDHPQVQKQIEYHVNLCQHGATLRSLLEFDALNAPPEYPMHPPSSTWHAVQQGQAVAAEERRRLGLGDNPIPDMADLITAGGIWASGTNLPDEISGMFLRHSSIGMVILVNFEHGRPRKRFSYAHEYAHSLLDRSTAVTVSRSADRNQLSEVRANAFAAAFLMPESGIHAFLAHRNKCLGSRESIPVYDPAAEDEGVEIQALRRSPPGAQQVHYQLVARMAHQFGVSYSAACYRLRSLKCVNDSQLSDLLQKQDLATRFLDLFKVKRKHESQRDESAAKPDRELMAEFVSLAVEAYDRELISKAKLIELGALVGIDRNEMLDLVRA
jgi:Zn-dependent peptidase ImmA (M78 family)/transcriptional regulator with XRE-family HTH domain